MEPSLNPDDIPALNAEYIDRRTRDEEQGGDTGTGDSFLDTMIEMSEKIGNDVVGSVKTGEIVEGPVFGIARAGFELMRLFGPGFIGGEGGVGDIGSKAMDIGIKKMETTTGQIAAFAAPYVITGTASILGAGSLAVKLGIGPLGKFLMQLGAGGASDFAVGATMEPPDENNIAHLIVQLAEADPDSALLQTAAPLFEYLASAETDPEIVKRLKRGAIEALTNVSAEVGFVAVKGIPMLVKGLKGMSDDGGLRLIGDSLERLEGTARTINRDLHKEGVEGIDFIYGSEVKDPRQIEMMLARGGQRLGVALNAIADMVKGSKAAGEKATKGAAETIGAGLGALFSTMFGGGEAEAGGTGKILATLAEAGLEPAEPFFSKAQRVIEETTTQRASPAQWRGTLANAGVKDEEFEWLGLDALLKGRSPVSKDDLAAHIELNKIQVKDVTLGLPERMRDLDTISQELHGRPFNELTASENAAVQRELFQGAFEGSAPTKFETYTLPGGENYRELLLQLPGKRTAITTEAEVVNAELRDLIVQEPIVARRTPEMARQIDELRERRNALHGLSAETPEFTGGHFDETNVLAHVRFNERVDAGGARTVFLEEIQSDWIAVGRQKGFQIPFKRDELTATLIPPRPESGPQGAAFWEITDKNGQLIVRGPDRMTEQQAIDSAIQMGPPGEVPNVPFKKTWHEMALKRMIRYAAENDFDNIAWTTGKQQVDRYDLSKQVDSVEVINHIKGGRFVDVRKDGQSILDFRYDDFGKIIEGRNEFVGKDLHDVLGKELADKVMAVPRDAPVQPGTTSVARFEGLDLKIGGTGLKNFYDRTLTNYAKKLGKKFGTKPEMVEFPGAVTKDVDKGLEILEELASEMGVDPRALAADIRQADVLPHDLNVTPEDFTIMQIAAEEAKGFTAWSMRITDRLRETALKEGFPLFSAALAPLGAIPELPGPLGGDQ